MKELYRYYYRYNPGTRNHGYSLEKLDEDGDWVVIEFNVDPFLRNLKLSGKYEHVGTECNGKKYTYLIDLFD